MEDFVILKVNSKCYLNNIVIFIKQEYRVRVYERRFLRHDFYKKTDSPKNLKEREELDVCIQVPPHLFNLIFVSAFRLKARNHNKAICCYFFKLTFLIPVRTPAYLTPLYVLYGRSATKYVFLPLIFLMNFFVFAAPFRTTTLPPFRFLFV